jgi:iron complex outermembrane recepter protein
MLLMKKFSMFRFLMVGFYFHISIFAAGQNDISGTLVNNENEPIAGASISLLHKPDSSLIKITLSKSDGSFRLLVKEGLYLLKITATGFQALYVEVPDNGSLSLGNLIMIKHVTELQAVKVNATKPLFQFLPDRTILNIDAAPSNAGNNLLELLNKLPDVVVDLNGNISINGKPGVLITIDGRETFLSGEALLNTLRGMSAASSDQIEVITNPSAKYEAIASGGIINIKTKKGQQEGFNGTISNSTGIGVFNDIDDQNKIAWLQNTSLNWNYRKNRINIYGTLGYNRGYHFENFKTNRWFFDPGSKRPEGSYFSWSHLKAPSDFYQLRLAMDWTLNESHLFGLIINQSLTNSTAAGGAKSHVSTNSGEIEYSMNSVIVSPQAEDVSGNYNINHKFTSKEKKIEVLTDLALIDFDGASVTNNETYFFAATGQQFLPPLFRRQFADNKFKGQVIKSDLMFNSRRGWRWEGGYKFSLIETTSIPVFFRKQNNEFLIDGGRTNYFKYSDRIHAVYASTSRTLKKTTIQTGLRLEGARGEGYQRINDSSFTRTWVNLFPSLYIQHQVSKQFQLVLNYSRKIKRPTAGNLNPYTYFTDSLYSNSGNPFLQPHFANNLEGKGILLNKYALTLSYTAINNFITTVVAHEPLDKTIRVRQQNFKQYRLFYVSATLPYTIVNGWNINLTASAGKNSAEGFALSETIRESASYWSINFGNNIIFSPQWSADVNMNYTSPQLSGLFVITRPLTYSLGVRRNLAGNRGSISFSSSNPLYIPHYGFDAAYANTAYASRFSTLNQNYRLTLNLKFGKQTVAQQRAKKNAIEEEQSRM